MASMGYLDIPPTATRLQNKPYSIQPEKRILTSLPTPTPSPTPPSPPTSAFANLTSPTNAAFAMLPQMLLSSTLPGLDTKPPVKDRPAKPGTPALLTTRDPLSIPTTSTNFRRFVARAGPIFWVQDRVEEIMFWRRGWKLTTIWIAVYAFLCYFPRVVFLLPHIILTAAILATYPYANANSSAASSPTPPPTNDFGLWQANIQAIQNLMGFVSDTYDLVEPYTHHLMLTPAHLPPLAAPSTPTSKPAASNPPSPSPSPYTPYILLSLILSFPPLAFLVTSHFFPARLVCFIAGVLPISANHPSISPILLQSIQSPDPWVLFGQHCLDLLLETKVTLQGRWERFCSTILRRLPMNRRNPKDTEETLETYQEPDKIPILTLLERVLDDDRLDDRSWRSEMREVELWENERFVRAPGAPLSTAPSNTARRTASLDISMSNLAANLHAGTDSGVTSAATTTYSTPQSTTPAPPASPAPYAAVRRFSLSQSLLQGVLTPQTGTSTPTPGPGPGPGVWSKLNLRHGERKGWTRGRDGWGGVRPLQSPTGGAGAKRRAGAAGEDTAHGDEDMHHLAEEDHAQGGEGEGYVSSNLTFSLAPGWSFVRTEGWRQDRLGKWAGVESSDATGWVYTNDTWNAPRGVAEAGSVTRRRRWVRRVWYDGNTEGAGGSAGGRGSGSHK